MKRWYGGKSRLREWVEKWTIERAISISAQQLPNSYSRRRTPWIFPNIVGCHSLAHPSQSFLSKFRSIGNISQFPSVWVSLLVVNMNKRRILGRGLGSVCRQSCCTSVRVLYHSFIRPACHSFYVLCFLALICVAFSLDRHVYTHRGTDRVRLESVLSWKETTWDDRQRSRSNPVCYGEIEDWRYRRSE